MEPRGRGSPGRKALLGALALVLVAAGGCTSELWGPLAVVEAERDGPFPGVPTPIPLPTPNPEEDYYPGRGGPAVVPSGTLAISEECAILVSDRELHPDAEELTLVWRSARTEWDAEAREIVYDVPDRGQVRLGDGDELTLAPGEDHRDAYLGGRPDLPWVAEPHSSCPGDLWGVEFVSVQTP